jgi:hypothetical protein
VGWKEWIAIVGVLLVGLMVFMYMNRQQWVKRDVERQLQIAELQREADVHAAAAANERQRKEAAMASAAMHAAARAESDAELEGMRKRWKSRPVSQDVAELQAQIEQADALIAKLDVDLARADKTIFALNEALVASDAEAISLQSQAAANEQAWKIEHERTESWQQQTKRGRVKTAFLTIGVAVGGGLAGYGIGTATQ